MVKEIPRKRGLLLLIIGTCLTFGTGAGLYCYFTPRSDLPVFNLDGQCEGLLRVRYENEAHHSILIALEGGPLLGTGSKICSSYYRYQSDEAILEPVGPSFWSDSTERIVIPNEPDWRASPSKVDWERHVISSSAFGGKTYEFTTRGRQPLAVIETPDADHSAVLSTDGTKAPATSGWYAASGGGYFGQHYIEFVLFPQAQRVGQPVRISFTTAQGLADPCWTSDGRYLVLTTSDCRKLIVVDSKLGGGDG